MIIQIKGINKYYINGENKLHALKDINLGIKKGEFVAIMGSSGSGKSTMMNILGCLDKEFEGEYILDGISVGEVKEDNLCKIRNSKIGFVFQSFNLLPKLTTQENVELPLVYAGVHKDEREKRALEVLKKVGLEKRVKHKPNELSGGQRQRVAIARALINNPAIILADEPTGNLDSQNSSEVIALLKETSKKYEQTIIMITHNRSIAQTADRVLQVSDGTLTDFGRCRE